MAVFITVFATTQRWDPFLKKVSLRWPFNFPKVLIGGLSYFAPTWCSEYKSLLNEKRLINFFDSLCGFGNCCGNSSNSYRTSFKFIDDGLENLIVHLIQSVRIDM